MYNLISQSNIILVHNGDLIFFLYLFNLVGLVLSEIFGMTNIVYKSLKSLKLIRLVVLLV